MALKFIKLTRPAIRSLHIGERITEHGIIAERLSSGDIRFSINIMVDGERIHRVIGRESEGTTREQAERAIETFRTKAREGRLELPRGRKTHRRFAEAASEYLARIEHHPKHGRNFARKSHHVANRLTPHFRRQRLDQLSDLSLSRYVQERKSQGAAFATINRELSTLSHFLNRAIEWSWIQSRPRIDKAQEPRKQVTVLTAEEQQRLLRAAVGDQDPFTWIFVSIAMGTAMRHSEIVRMRWDQLDFDQRRIFVPRAKAGYRQQPMPSALSHVLRKHWINLGEPDGWLFPTQRADAKHDHRQSMAGQFRRAVKRAQLDPKKVTPHVMRHTAITALVQAGVDLPTIQKVSGHKTLSMVLRYTHLADKHVNEAVETLDAGFPGSSDLDETRKQLAA